MGETEKPAACSTCSPEEPIKNFATRDTGTKERRQPERTSPPVKKTKSRWFSYLRGRTQAPAPDGVLVQESSGTPRPSASSVQRRLREAHAARVEVVDAVVLAQEGLAEDHERPLRGGHVHRHQRQLARAVRVVDVILRVQVKRRIADENRNCRQRRKVRAVLRHVDLLNNGGDKSGWAGELRGARVQDRAAPMTVARQGRVVHRKTTDFHVPVAVVTIYREVRDVSDVTPVVRPAESDLGLARVREEKAEGGRRESLRRLDSREKAAVRTLGHLGKPESEDTIEDVTAEGLVRLGRRRYEFLPIAEAADANAVGNELPVD